jgi:hypothetical protein
MMVGLSIKNREYINEKRAANISIYRNFQQFKIFTLINLFDELDGFVLIVSLC